MIVPIEKYGVKWMSIGYFAEAGQPLIWRGPMASNALKQMVLQVKWGELDFLLIDLPPGTGDIHISIVHDIPLSGAIVVSTPQAVALADVEKGVNMFRNKDINKPVLGFVENMAWFTPEELPENKYYIFGKDGCNAMSEKFDIPVLAQIPIVQSIRESGDNGSPVALTDRADSIAFRKLARKIIDMHA
ncbi:Iron-sulfur cluster carrier protein [bioreactor metagenome]|uniref:Iron-sulfur cluster carrier protein n=1 Tax=bioreactor metagenome TaxID=1076179 RepID=A0A645E1L8_9ZZZZ